MRIIYGGAITPYNIQKLIELPDNDGFLFGLIAQKSEFKDVVTTVNKFAKEKEILS